MRHDPDGLGGITKLSESQFHLDNSRLKATQQLSHQLTHVTYHVVSHELIFKLTQNSPINNL